MLKFAANLSFLFTQLPFMERFAAAHKAGFRFVEFMFPYDYDLKAIAAELDKNKLQLVLFNMPAGNWAQGERGLAAIPQRKNDFQAGVYKAIEGAKYLGVERINCLAGIKPEQEREEIIYQTLGENIAFAADQLAKEKLNLMIEPINHFDMPGFYLNTTSQVIKLLQEINRSNVFLQYDIYHGLREGEDYSYLLANHFSQIGHVQIADSPGRNQPGTGVGPLKDILAQLAKGGYGGYIGLEYLPKGDTVNSLSWVKEYGYSL